MNTSTNSPNSVDVAFSATFYSVPALVEETDADAPIVEEGGLPYDDGGETGGEIRRWVR